MNSYTNIVYFNAMEKLSTHDMRARILKEIAKTVAIVEEYKGMTKPVAHLGRILLMPHSLYCVNCAK